MQAIIDNLPYMLTGLWYTFGMALIGIILMAFFFRPPTRGPAEFKAPSGAAH